MAYNLRQYQTETLDRIWTDLQTDLNVLLSAPCAAGKTLIFSKIIRRLLSENSDFRVLVLTDREILINQTIEKLQLVAPELMLDIGTVCTGFSKNHDGGKRVTVASRQTLINRLDNFIPVHLTIIDECHLLKIPRHDDDYDKRDQFGNIIFILREKNPNMRLFGVTATPYRLSDGYIYGTDNKAGSIPYFSRINHEITVDRLLKEGFLAPLKGVTAVTPTVRKQLDNVQITAGEYNLGDLDSIMSSPAHIASAVEAWEKHAREFNSDKEKEKWFRKKTVAFCVTIEHCNLLEKAFNNAGIPAIPIHSGLSDIESDIAYEALKNGTSTIFCSVAKLTTGMDIIDIDCLLICRPTKSAALHKQILGRGMRIDLEKYPYKKDCLVIDMVGNIGEFGTDLDNLKVSYTGQTGKKKADEDEIKYKQCPQCHKTDLHPALIFCDCGFKFQQTYTEAETPELKGVVFGKQEPSELPVISMYPKLHQSKKNGRELLQVRFELEPDLGFKPISASLWLCFSGDGYSGYAVEAGAEKWAMLTHENNSVPASAYEAVQRENEILTPETVVVDLNGEWPKILELKYDENPLYEILHNLESYKETHNRPYETMPADPQTGFSDDIEDDDIPF